MKKCPAEEEEDGDAVKCTGQSCKSCTAGMIADCVAVCCCCPCSVVNILVFALLKVPWMVGKRIFRRGKTTSSRRRKKPEEWEHWVGKAGPDIGAVSGMELPGFGEADQQVWFELHQFGHLGFGRVSFTGIQI